MDKRILLGCIAALATLFGFDLLTKISGWPLDVPLRTPLGMIYIGSVLVTFAAMALGGWIARRHFRWVALALSVVVWIATIAALQAIAAPMGAPTLSLAGIVKFNALAIVLSLAASWLGALLGERLVARQHSPALA